MRRFGCTNRRKPGTICSFGCVIRGTISAISCFHDGFACISFEGGTKLMGWLGVVMCFIRCVGAIGRAIVRSSTTYTQEHNDDDDNDSDDGST